MNVAIASIANLAGRIAGFLSTPMAGGDSRSVLAAHGWLDTATGLCNADGLAAVGEPLLDAARACGRPFAVVVLDFEDVAEVREIYGRQIARQVLGRIVRKAQELAGPGGVTVRTGYAQFTVLLPGTGRDAARAKAERALGRPCRVEIEVEDCEIVLVPDIAADTVAHDGEALVEAHRELAQGIAQQRHAERRRREWLARERERHSRPQPLAA